MYKWLPRNRGHNELRVIYICVCVCKEYRFNFILLKSEYFLKELKIDYVQLKIDFLCVSGISINYLIATNSNLLTAKVIDLRAEIKV